MKQTKRKRARNPQEHSSNHRMQLCLHTNRTAKLKTKGKLHKTQKKKKQTKETISNDP